MGQGDALTRRRMVIAAAALLIPAGRAAGAPDPAGLPAGDYVLDPARASLRADLSILGGLYRESVRFRDLTGRFAYDPENWAATRVAITVDPRSADAGSKAFSRAAVAFFEPDLHPEIRFASARLAPDADGRGRLSGDLTLHGVTRPIVLDIRFTGLAGGRRLGFSGAARIRRSDFGLRAGRLVAGDWVDLVFEVEFVKQ